VFSFHFQVPAMNRRGTSRTAVNTSLYASAAPSMALTILEVPLLSIASWLVKSHSAVSITSHLQTTLNHQGRYDWMALGDVRGRMPRPSAQGCASRSLSTILAWRPGTK